MAATEDIRRQYERWPYPRIPLAARVAGTVPWQLDAAWLWDRCGRGTAPRRPRIWLAGCGTFQPYVFAVANPGAEIVATDLSRRSLEIARRRCRRHGHAVRTEAADLADPATWPQGRFDVIECYGVLMNLEDPETVLRGLAERLTDGGVLRVMVYPHWSRQRIFQIQRVARLLGLHAGDGSHPRRLHRLVRRLPGGHPLRHAWDGYGDARHDAGVVDAFLHAGDRGFTAHQWLGLCGRAGLRPVYWFHPEWAQPAVAAERLGLEGRSQAAVLGYLDLWQELRGNLVTCLVRDGAVAGGPPPQTSPAGRRVHPLFDPGNPGLRWRHRLRLRTARWTGMRLASKVSDPVRLSAADVRLLGGGPGALVAADPGVVARLAGAGLVLGDGDRPAEELPRDWEAFPGEEELLDVRLELDGRAANPFYDHLFKAWSLHVRCPELGFPGLDEQMGRWLPWADPLEDGRTPFGLTPYRTRQRFRVNVDEYLERFADRETVTGWDAVRLRGDGERLDEVRAYLAGVDALPVEPLAPQALRELWVLLFSWRELFLRLDPA